MINKKIHYVGVGGKEIPPKIKNMIEKTKKILGPKGEIKVWTEKNFDIDSNIFTKYGYSKKQWAFVSDYIRAFAVYKEGGFYFDTDINLQKSIDEFTKYDYVASRTNVVGNTMSIFGAKKGHKFLKEYMELSSNKGLYKLPPKIMSTHFHTYVISKNMEVPNVNDNFIANNIAILSEDLLQLDLKNRKNYAIHEHHDNGKGSSDLNISKYYFNKIKFYNNLTHESISKEANKRRKMIKKIDKRIIS